MNWTGVLMPIDIGRGLCNGDFLLMRRKIMNWVGGSVGLLCGYWNFYLFDNTR